MVEVANQAKQESGLSKDQTKELQAKMAEALKKFGNLEANIPLNNEYWFLRNQLITANEQKKYDDEQKQADKEKADREKLETERSKKLEEDFKAKMKAEEEYAKQQKEYVNLQVRTTSNTPPVVVGHPEESKAETKHIKTEDKKTEEKK